MGRVELGTPHEVGKLAKALEEQIQHYLAQTRLVGKTDDEVVFWIEEQLKVRQNTAF